MVINNLRFRSYDIKHQLLESISFHNLNFHRAT